MTEAEAAPPSKVIVHDGLTYRTQGDSVYVGQNRRAKGSITIPAAVASDGKSYPVSSLGQSAFHLNKDITRIAFAPGSSLTFIADRAIQFCENLAELVLPPSLRHIHPSTFRRTPKLAAVTAPGSDIFAVADGVLYTKERTRLLFVPRTRGGAFVIPQVVTAVGAYALEGCRAITAITFAPGCQVKEIGDGAFAGSGITEFRLPKSVTSFVGEAPNAMAQKGKFPREGFLQDCASLTRIEFERNDLLIELPESAFRGTKIEALTIPRSVQKLGVQCFAKTLSLRTLTFEPGSACTTIETDVFYSTGLESLVLPASINFIAPSQFFSSPKLVSLSFSGPNAKYVIENGLLFTADRKTLLFGSRALTDVRIPASVETIAANAFCKCRSLRRATFEEPSSVTLIDAYAFYDTALQSIDVPDTVTKLGENAFGNCIGLSNVRFGPGSTLDELGRRVFGLTSISSFVGPSSLRKVGSAAFANSKVRNVKLLDRVDSVDKLAFYKCHSLQNLTMTNPGSIRIEKNAFETLGPECTIHKTETAEITGLEGLGLTIDHNTTIEISSVETYEPAAPPGTSWAQLALDPDERAKIPGVRPRRGTYGSVFKCQHRVTGAISAVKELFPTEGVLDSFTKETEVLSRLRHPAILGIIGFVMPMGDVPPTIVTEWMPNGSLEDVLKNPADWATLSATQKMKIIVGVCQGMRYIHRSGGIHRDLKPANILLDANFEPRIADLGSAKFTDPGATLTNTLSQGTPLYMAPEVIDDNTYTTAVDVFSFAMTLWELLSGRTLVKEFEKELGNAFTWIQKVQKGKRPPTDRLGRFWAETLQNSWGLPSIQRKTFDEILTSFKTANYQLLEGVDSAAVAEYVQRLDNFEDEWRAEGIEF